MRAWKAKRALWIVALGASNAGCQIVGGLHGELSFNDDAGSLPPRDALVWEARDPGAVLVYTLPDWLGHRSKNETRTSQIGPGMLRLGYLEHEARPRNVGMGWGLAMETTRTNLLPNGNWMGAGWVTPNASMMVLPGGPAPAEGAEGVMVYSKGSQSSPFVALQSGDIASAWLMGVQGEAPFGHLAYGNAFATVDDVDGGFHRYEVLRLVADAEPALRLSTEATAAGPAITNETAMVVYGAQVEEGAYPSSYIPTTAGAVTREADRMFVEMEMFAPSNYFDVTIRYAPHYAQNEQRFDHDLLALEDDNVFFRMKPGGTLLLFQVGSQDNVRIDGLDWAREQELEVRVQYLPNRRTIWISGATKGDGSAAKSGPVEPVGKDATVWILGDNDGPQESVDLRYIEIR